MRIRHLAWMAAGPVLLGAAMTTALPAGAAVANPIVLDTCVTAVQGSPGQPVALRPGALLQPITDVLAPLDPLGVLRTQLNATWTKLPPIPIGAISAGPAWIPGTTIGDSVVHQLGSVSAVSPVLALLAAPVRATVTGLCGVATQPASQPAPQAGSPVPQPVTSPGASRTRAPAGSPQSPGRTPAAIGGHDTTHGPGIAGGAAPEGAAGDGVPDAGVPPEGVVTLSNQPLPPYILPGVSPDGVITLSNQPSSAYVLPGLTSQSGVTQYNAASPQPSQGSVAGDAATAHTLDAGEIGSNRLRLLPAFTLLLLALVLSQFVRSWALRSSQGNPRRGAHAAPGGSPSPPPES